PAKEKGIGSFQLGGPIAMQLLVRDPHLVIAAAVEGDVDRVSERSHSLLPSWVGRHLADRNRSYAARSPARVSRRDETLDSPNRRYQRIARTIASGENRKPTSGAAGLSGGALGGRLRDDGAEAGGTRSEEAGGQAIGGEAARGQEAGTIEAIGPEHRGAYGRGAACCAAQCASRCGAGFRGCRSARDHRPRRDAIAAVVPDLRLGADRNARPRRRHQALTAHRAAGTTRRVGRDRQPPGAHGLLRARADLPAARELVLGTLGVE